VFAAECQNEPMSRQAGAAEIIERDGLERIIGTLPRGVVPGWTNKVTAFIDIQHNVLWWMVVAWGEGFRGAIVDYGAHPEQGRRYFAKADARLSYRNPENPAGFEVELRAALDTTIDGIMSRAWKTENGRGTRTVDMMFIDINWVETTGVALRAIQESTHRSSLRGSRGTGHRSGVASVSSWKPRAGDVRKWNLVERFRERHGSREVSYDTDRFKTLVMKRLNTPKGGDNIELFRGDVATHAMVLDHLCAEYPEEKQHKGELIDVWHEKPHQDNDLFDGLTGSAAAAVFAGLDVPGQAPKPKKKRRRGHVASI
jgi:phage terminase large subunit GpA-like protein